MGLELDRKQKARLYIWGTAALAIAAMGMFAATALMPPYGSTLTASPQAAAIEERGLQVAGAESVPAVADATELEAQFSAWLDGRGVEAAGAVAKADPKAPSARTFYIYAAGAWYRAEAPIGQGTYAFEELDEKVGGINGA